MTRKFIAGIYNYCDRWCERCDFTSRCKNYDGISKLPPEETIYTMANLGDCEEIIQWYLFFIDWAWTRLFELIPSSEDTALKSLSLLTQIKQKTLEEFPEALNFKRPGLDD